MIVNQHIYFVGSIYESNLGNPIFEIIWVFSAKPICIFDISWQMRGLFNKIITWTTKREIYHIGNNKTCQIRHSFVIVFNPLLYILIYKIYYSLTTSQFSILISVVSIVTSFSLSLSSPFPISSFYDLKSLDIHMSLLGFFFFMTAQWFKYSIWYKYSSM